MPKVQFEKLQSDVSTCYIISSEYTRFFFNMFYPLLNTSTIIQTHTASIAYAQDQKLINYIKTIKKPL